MTSTKSCNFYEKLWFFMKSCDFCEELQLLRRVATFMKSCNFNKELWHLWRVATFIKKIVTFMKDCDLSKDLCPFQLGSIRIYSHYPLFSINRGNFFHFNTTKILNFLFCTIKYMCTLLLLSVSLTPLFLYQYTGE